jgi:phosphopantothenoylcysteine decarboxylase/phosphopantothenate--cysteine ligase
MSLPLENRRVLLAVTGGIAAYKAADLASRLRKAGAAVRVAMTRAATRFVAPLTFETLAGYPVYSDVFDQPAAWEMEHIGWARWGEILLVAPATANVLARLAHGLADDAVTTLALAFTGPVWVAPAMNTAMWNHPATQANLALLKSRGVRVIEPAVGPLACGEIGAGRMAEPADVVETLAAELALLPATPLPAATAPGGSLVGRTVLVTAGPTREPLDPIRFLSNRSSGRMGVELAVEAAARGARVLLVHGPLAVPVPLGVEARPVETARAMLQAVQELWPAVDVALFAAAVANFELAAAADRKIKESDRLTLELRRTPDIAAWCGAHRRPGQLLVGFAAETHDLLEAAREKLARKRLDLICANVIGAPGLGFAAAANQLTLLASDGRTEESPVLPKRLLAGWIWDRLTLRLAVESESPQRPAAAAHPSPDFSADTSKHAE